MTISLSTTAPCPCTSGRAFGECCEPLLTGKRPAATAEALMRSRYTAYAVNQVDYIADTDLPTGRGDFDRNAATAWATKSEWTGLTVSEVLAGGAGDDTGTVEFIAHFKLAGKEQQHRERATFKRVDGRWFYVDGQAPAQVPFKKQEPEVGRNEPCPCGSGKKYKKCHGA